MSTGAATPTNHPAACEGDPEMAKKSRDPVEQVNRLGAKWSPDFGDYAAGASAIRCALCANAPCQCPPFGTPDYFALVDRRHGRR
jgi:hypothetical protein